MNKTTSIFIVILLLIIGGSIVISKKAENKPGKLDTFAMCLEEKDAKFYGAFWCSHCNQQKDLFKNSKKHLPYIECSETNKTQKQICIDENIESYPTWKFADGTVETGEKSLEFLAEKTGCELPQ